MPTSWDAAGTHRQCPLKRQWSSRCVGAPTTSSQRAPTAPVLLFEMQQYRLTGFYLTCNYRLPALLVPDSWRGRHLNATSYKRASLGKRDFIAPFGSIRYCCSRVVQKMDHVASRNGDGWESVIPTVKTFSVPRSAAGQPSCSFHQWIPFAPRFSDSQTHF